MEDEVAKLQKQADAPAEGQTSTDTGEAKTEDDGDPTLLAGKYQDAAELEKAYLELQRKFSETTGAKEGDEEGPAFSIKSKGDEEKAADPVDTSRYKREMLEDGQLSEQSMKELKGMGFDEELMAHVMKGLEDTKATRQREILEVFGSQTRMDEISRWAGANLTEKEIELIETQARSLDSDVARSALKGLVARYESSPMGQQSLEGVTGGPSVQPFKSNHEMTQAMNDPRYKKDEAYRAEVAARIMGM